MKNKCTKFRNYRPYTAKSLGTWKMFDNPTDNHTDIEVPLYYELRFTKLKIYMNTYAVQWVFYCYTDLADKLIFLTTKLYKVILCNHQTQHSYFFTWSVSSKNSWTLFISSPSYKINNLTAMVTLISMPTLWDIDNHANFIKAGRAAYWFSMLPASLLLLAKAWDAFH